MWSVFSHIWAEYRDFLNTGRFEKPQPYRIRSYRLGEFKKHLLRQSILKRNSLDFTVHCCLNVCVATQKVFACFLKLRFEIWKTLLLISDLLVAFVVYDVVYLLWLNVTSTFICRYTLFQSRKTLYAPKVHGVLKKKKQKKNTHTKKFSRLKPSLKGALSGLRQFSATESHLKMIKMFLFYLKSSFHSQDI